MIKNFIITGDCHGDFSRFLNFSNMGLCNPMETAFIILGDFGANFYLNKTDKRKKTLLQELGFTYYAVRGNHESRPEDLPNMHLSFDEQIDGAVYLEDDYPNIRYLVDGFVYNFDGRRTLVLGGAYSVDKYHRLLRADLAGDEDPKLLAKRGGWFYNEQLSEEERDLIYANIKKDPHFDIVLSHTCPLNWAPTDLFLSGLDQNSIDKTMEKWLDKIEKTIDYKVWLFGHYHDDRWIQPHVQMFYETMEELSRIWNRWNENN